MKENGIYLFGEKKTLAVGIKPEGFKLRALREIVRYQIYNENQTEIAIDTPAGRQVILRQELLKGRELTGNDKRVFLDSIAETLSQSHKIIIKIVSGAKIKDPPPHKESPDPLNASIINFIEDNPNLSYADEISGKKIAEK